MTRFVNDNTPPVEMLYNKYEQVKKIGQGFFGDVWLVKDRAIQREFALKVIKPGSPIVKRLREAQIGNLLTHKNLVQVHQADVMNVFGQEYVVIAMDFMRNGAVTSLPNPSGYLILPDVLRIACDILQGLDFLHERHFFHNDIKPENILLGDQNQAMLSDYGITGISADGSPVSAPSNYVLHCAPEVHTDGNVGVNTDIFQVGMTLARLLLGLDYLNEILKSVGQSEYEKRIKDGNLLTAKDFPGHIPSKVSRVVLRAIHPDPALRYENSLQMRREIEKLSFPGYWSVDKSGREFGRSGTYRYEYDLDQVGKGQFNLTCTRRNEQSGNIWRISDFCKKKLPSQQAKKLIKKFKQSVVTGKWH